MRINLSRIIKILCLVFAAGMFVSCKNDTVIITSPNGIKITANETEAANVDDIYGENSVTFTSGAYFSGNTRPDVVRDKQYLPEISIDLPESGKIVYSVNDKSAGKISGKKIQDAGDPTTVVEAKANLGYKFVKWSDGVTDAERSGDTVEGVYTAVFDYDVLDMPIIIINTNDGRAITSKTDYAKATYSVLGCSEEYVIDAETMRIRGRGNNSWGYPKKSYKFKLDKKSNLLDIADGAERVWCLIANQCDQSLQRNHIAFELGRYFNDIAWEPASTSVEVYLNGEYVGVYLLTEDIQISDNRVDIDDTHKNEIDTGYLLEMSNYAQGEVIYAADLPFMIHSDLSSDSDIKKEQMRYIKEYIEECYEALISGDRGLAEELIDINSLVAVYLVEEITKNLDSQWDSFYLHKDSGGKLVFGPIWDFDLSLGNADSGAEKYTDIFVGNGLGSGGGFGTWFAVAMSSEWFREMVVDKWLEIYDSISLIPQFIIDEAELGINSYERNFEKWKIMGIKQNRETQYIIRLKSFEQHYKYLVEWTENRIEWLNNAFTDEKFITKGKGLTVMKWWDSKRLSANTDKRYGNDAAKEIAENYESLMSYLRPSSIKGPDGFSGEGVENLFDNEKDTKYCLTVDDEITVSFSFSEEKAVEAYLFCTGNDTQANPERNPDKWIIYGSNDGVNWDVISEIENGEDELGGYDHVWYGFKVDTPAEYKEYKIVLKNSGIMQLSEIQFMAEK